MQLLLAVVWPSSQPSSRMRVGMRWSPQLLLVRARGSVLKELGHQWTLASVSCLASAWHLIVICGRSASYLACERKSAHRSIDQRAYLVWFEFRPFLTIEFLIEAYNEQWVDKIDKGIADVALVSEIYGQIEEIKKIFMFFIEISQHHLLVVLIGDVLNHQSCPLIRPIQNFR